MARQEIKIKIKDVPVAKVKKKRKPRVVRLGNGKVKAYEED